MAEERRYTINLLPQPEGGFTVLVPALPEVVTEGDTREEALANAKEAIEAWRFGLIFYSDVHRKGPGPPCPPLQLPPSSSSANAA